MFFDPQCSRSHSMVPERIMQRDTCSHAKCCSIRFCRQLSAHVTLLTASSALVYFFFFLSSLWSTRSLQQPLFTERSASFFATSHYCSVWSHTAIMKQVSRLHQMSQKMNGGRLQCIEIWNNYKLWRVCF